MSSITIRNLEPAIKERLRFRAAEYGHSMEAEARRILRAALRGSRRPSGRSLYERIDTRFAPLGGVNLEFSHANPSAPLRLMFILDTNILSTMMAPNPAPEVRYDVRRAASTTLP